MLLFVATGLIFQSCGKEGPQGPQGNANVVSAEFNIASTAWSYDATNSWDLVDIPWSGITPDIVDNGTVLAYLEDGTNDWVAIPFSEAFSNGSGLSQHWTSAYTDGQMEIDVQNSDFSEPANPSGTNGITIKLVAIAGTVRKMMTNQNVNTNSYQEVEKFFKENKLTR